MSSSTAGPPPTASPSPSPTGRGDQGGSGTSSNLYLVTFLATLFLLLFVSCAIVMRSYILRRRFQREQDDQLAAGRFLAPRTQGSKRKRFGAKPKLIDTWLAVGGVTWDHIKPLSAQPVFVKRKYRDGRVPKDSIIISGGPPQTGIENPNPNVNDLGFTAAPRRTPLRHLFSRTRRTSALSQETPDTEEADGLVDAEVIATSDVPPSQEVLGLNEYAVPTLTPAITYKVRVEMLQVSVLIAMPSQDRTIKKNKALDHIGNADEIETEDEDEDEDEDTPLPELVFGVTRVNYRQPKSQKSNDNNATSTSQQKQQTMPTVPEEEL